MGYLPFAVAADPASAHGALLSWGEVAAEEAVEEGKLCTEEVAMLGP